MKLRFGWLRHSAPHEPSCQTIARDMIARANAARDAGQFAQAAFLYGEAVRLRPERADIHVQHGHMLKEAGDLTMAGRAYARALKLMPKDADLQLQIGHLHKSRGHVLRAVAAYRRALALKPKWARAQAELNALQNVKTLDGDDALARAAASPHVLRSVERETMGAGRELLLSAALAPGSPLDGLHGHGEELALRRLGKYERTPWGLMNVVRGVQAFRGFCISAVPVLSIEIFLNGLLIHRGGLAGGFVIPHERDNPALRKYVFNVWIDVTPFTHGRYDVMFRARDIGGRTFERSESVVVAPRIPPSVLPDSDTDVPPPDPANPASLDEQVNGRPSMVRPARRALLQKMPRTVLVQRPDVLGDLVVAVPALRRLRELLPGARIVGMLSPGNVDLARTLGLFDDIVITELVFDPWERRRVVTAENQKKLAADLARFDFDLAIDLGTSPDSRLLLPLSRAPVLVGFRSDDLPGQLTVEVTGGTKDPWNGHETVPHTNMAMGLVEWLAAMMRNEPTLLQRDLDPALLSDVGLAPDVRYAVLHAGGRWEFARWPHYLELAEMLLASTDLHVVLMTTDPSTADRLPPSLANDARFQVLHRRLAFDELDALLTFCTVFVGDDSGIKHLASMRGAKVIGIHNARNNWSEWGHDNRGYIMTRKVPCAGCLIQNYPESDECGRAFVCITGITPHEVLAATLRLVDAPAGQA
jgi:ADP-heptose:LPS heptosyltransferase